MEVMIMRRLQLYDNTEKTLEMFNFSTFYTFCSSYHFETENCISILINLTDTPGVKYVFVFGSFRTTCLNNITFIRLKMVYLYLYVGGKCIWSQPLWQIVLSACKFWNVFLFPFITLFIIKVFREMPSHGILPWWRGVSTKFVVWGQMCGQIALFYASPPIHLSVEHTQRYNAFHRKLSVKLRQEYTYNSFPRTWSSVAIMSQGYR